MSALGPKPPTLRELVRAWERARADYVSNPNLENTNNVFESMKALEERMRFLSGDGILAPYIAAVLHALDAEEKKMSDQAENERRALVHHITATILGFNELATRAETLNEKVYFRMAREASIDALREAGGDIDVTRQPPVLSLGVPKPYVAFSADDIELMRACVVEHDAKGNDAKNTTGPMFTVECFIPKGHAEALATIKEVTASEPGGPGLLIQLHKVDGGFADPLPAGARILVSAFAFDAEEKK